MGSFNFSIGKGLREPCDPYREMPLFGAPLNSVEAENWNCLPQIVGATTAFDLSGLAINHEVVVASLTVSGVEDLFFTTRLRWYRERDNKLLYDYSFPKYAAYWDWYYAYSYIGYVAHEISENGTYYVQVSVSGDVSYNKTIYFTVSSLAEEILEPIIEPDASATIIELFNSVSSSLWSIYYQISGWIFPFNLISTPFYLLSQFFSFLGWRFSDFFTWINTLSAKVINILSWNTIWSYILSYIPNLEQVRDWFYYWRDWVLQEITGWWHSTTSTVLGWIDIAKQWSKDWIDWLSIKIDNLQVSWGNFATITLPTLASYTDVNALIRSWLLDYSPFWEGWQDWRGKVTEFFSDPEQWLYDKLDEFFERFW